MFPAEVPLNKVEPEEPKRKETRTKKGKKSTRGKRRKKRKSFLMRFILLSFRSIKEAATEKSLKRPTRLSKEASETDNDGNITVVVKGTADRVKFRVDKADKNKVDLHLGDEKWDEWRTDFTGAITNLVAGGSLELILGVTAMDPTDPAKQAFENFKTRV